MADIKEPPVMWSIAKKIQYYLDVIGFNTGGVDGLFGTKSRSGLILFQYYLNDKNVNLDLDDETLNKVRAAAVGGLTYAKVKAYLEKSWRRRTPTIDTTNKSENGHLSTENMVKIPTVSYEDAVAEKETAFAWAMLVKCAVEYNEMAADNNKLNISNFAAAGSNAAYRSYHYQVEAYVNYRHGGNLAACPTFTKGKKNIVRSNRFNANNAFAEAWIVDNWRNFIEDGKWNDVPEYVTAEGGDMEGYGHSDHGWGLAIDFCTGGEKSGRSYDKEVKWLEQHAGKFGFSPLLGEPPTFSLGSNNYRESWHWSYNI